MGIETGLAALGMSATTASAVATSVYAAAATAAISAATAPKPQKQDAPNPITAVDKPPGVQAEKAVDRNQLLDKNSVAAMGALSGNSSTLLTGSQGVTGGLNLGTSTLLGQ